MARPFGRAPLGILLACVAMVVLLALVSRGPSPSPVALKGAAAPVQEEEVVGEGGLGALEEPEDAPAQDTGDGAAPEEERAAAGEAEEDAPAADNAEDGEEEEAKEPPQSFSAALAGNPKREHVWQTVRSLNQGFALPLAKIRLA